MKKFWKKALNIVKEFKNQRDIGRKIWGKGERNREKEREGRREVGMERENSHFA